LSNDLINN